MGKGKKGGRGGTKYVHNHTYNPVARESDERKIERLHNMEVKRYQNYVDRNLKVITQYLPLDAIAYKKKKIGKILLYATALIVAIILLTVGVLSWW